MLSAMKMYNINMYEEKKKKLTHNVDKGSSITMQKMHTRIHTHTHTRTHTHKHTHTHTHRLIGVMLLSWNILREMSWVCFEGERVAECLMSWGRLLQMWGPKCKKVRKPWVLQLKHWSLNILSASHPLCVWHAPGFHRGLVLFALYTQSQPMWFLSTIVTVTSTLMILSSPKMHNPISPVLFSPVFRHTCINDVLLWMNSS